MEILAKIENLKGKQFTIKVKKPKVLAIPIFMAKLSRFANKKNKVIEFKCDDSQFLGLILPALPPTCEVSMIREA
jgi:hypothetical protein